MVPTLTGARCSSSLLYNKCPECPAFPGVLVFDSASESLLSVPFKLTAGESVGTLCETWLGSVVWVQKGQRPMPEWLESVYEEAWSSVLSEGMSCAQWLENVTALRPAWVDERLQLRSTQRGRGPGT